MHMLVLSIAQYYHGFYNSYNIDVHIGIVVIPLRVVCLVLAISIQMREHFDTSMYLNETPTVYHMFMSKTFKCLQRHTKFVYIENPKDIYQTKSPTQVSAKAHG